MLISNKANPNSMVARHARMVANATQLRQSYPFSTDRIQSLEVKPVPTKVIPTDSVKGHVVNANRYGLTIAPRNGGRHITLFIKSTDSDMAARAQQALSEGACHEFLFSVEPYGPFRGDLIMIS